MLTRQLNPDRKRPIRPLARARGVAAAAEAGAVVVADREHPDPILSPRYRKTLTEKSIATNLSKRPILQRPPPRRNHPV
jgi:hypothetical protein